MQADHLRTDDDDVYVFYTHLCTNLFLWQNHTHPKTTPTRVMSKSVESTPSAVAMTAVLSRSVGRDKPLVVHAELDVGLGEQDSKEQLQVLVLIVGGISKPRLVMQSITRVALQLHNEGERVGEVGSVVRDEGGVDGSGVSGGV